MTTQQLEAPTGRAATATSREGRTPQRGVRPGAVLTVLLIAQLMAILDVNIVNVAGATIRTDLHSGGAGLQMIISGYTMTYAILLITGARVGGIWGHRATFIAGLAGFTLASLACGLAPDSGWLVGFRLVQGAAAAFMIPQVFSLIQRHFSGAARVRALGRYAAVIASGIVLGQVLGGVLVDSNLFGTGWRPIFWINVPVGLIALVAAVRVLPADSPAEGTRRLDGIGLVTLAATVCAFVVPLILGHQEGWPLWIWLLLAVSVVLFAMFALVQRRVAAPLMPSRVVRARGMLPALAAIFLMMGGYAGLLFSLALHLQTGLRFSPLHAGLMFVPVAASFGLASLNWQRVPARWHRTMIVTGLAVAAVCTVLTMVSLRGTGEPGALFYIAQVPYGLASGVVFSPLMNAALATVAPRDAPDASGLVTTVLQICQVVGVATIGSLYLALVAHHTAAYAVDRALLASAVACLVAAVAAFLIPAAKHAPMSQ